MLVNRELVHQDLRGVHKAALEEECKKAARIALDNYNQALVQYKHVHAQTLTHRHTTPADVNAQGEIQWGFQQMHGALRWDIEIKIAN